MRKITMKKTNSNGAAAEDDNLRDNSEDRNGSEDDEDQQDEEQNEPIESDQDVEDEENGDSEPSKKKSKKSKKSKANGKAKGKGAAKRKKSTPKRAAQPEDEDEGGEKEYEVQKIVGKQTFSGKVHYLIRWKGYSAKDDTWEAEDTLHCADLIKDYLAAEKKLQTARKAAAPRRTQRVDYSEEDENDDVYYNNTTTTSRRKRPVANNRPAKKKARTEKQEEYEVDKILNYNKGKKGQREFLVSWKGYPESQATWEPENNLNCRDLLDNFLAAQEGENDGSDEDEATVAKKAKSPKKAIASPAKKGKSKRKAGRH